MATAVTLREEKFDTLLHRFDENCAVAKIPAPGVVELVEAGKADSPEMETLLQSILGPYRGRLDALVLGCTHYPFAAPVIARVLGPEVALLDGGEGTARETRRRLAAANLLREGAAREPWCWKTAAGHRKFWNCAATCWRCNTDGRKTMKNDILVIGIAGGTGSGKTTLMNNLISQFADVVTILSHDNYYKRHDELTYEQRCLLNYDEPDALETDLMARHLDQLRQGQPIDCPVYDFTLHNRSDKTIRIVPKKVIIVEGILIFENKELRELMDIRIFVDTDADVRLCRRIKRDVTKRGRTLESVLNQYLQTVKPMHERYVEPSKKYADLVVPEGGQNLVALDMIEGRIRRHLEGA